MLYYGNIQLRATNIARYLAGGQTQVWFSFKYVKPLNYCFSVIVKNHLKVIIVFRPLANKLCQYCSLWSVNVSKTRWYLHEIYIRT